MKRILKLLTPYIFLTLTILPAGIFIEYILPQQHAVASFPTGSPCRVATHTDVSVPNTTLKVLNRNTNRLCLVIQNKGSNAVIVKVGSAIGGSNEGINFPAGAVWEPSNVPIDEIDAKSTTGSNTLDIMEGIGK